MHQQLLVKGTRDKENKEKTKKQTQYPSCSSHLNKRTEDVKEQKTNTHTHTHTHTHTKDHTCPLSLHPHSNINQPAPPIPSPHLL